LSTDFGARENNKKIVDGAGGCQPPQDGVSTQLSTHTHTHTHTHTSPLPNIAPRLHRTNTFF
jgi:hypothetical protein